MMAAQDAPLVANLRACLLDGEDEVSGQAGKVCMSVVVSISDPASVSISICVWVSWGWEYECEGYVWVSVRVCL